MKIAISVVDPNLDSEVYPRFGRSEHFIIIDPETMQYDSVTNPHLESPSGAGIGSAQLLFKKGVSAVITGSIGPKAHQALEAVGIRMLTGVSGSVRNAIADFKAGKSSRGTEAGAQIDGRAGAQGGPGMGRGMGMGGGGRGTGAGRGMGCGGRRGMGMGVRTGRGGGTGGVSPRDWNADPGGAGGTQAGRTGELSSLRQQATRLANELTSIIQRIEQVEKQ